MTVVVNPLPALNVIQIIDADTGTCVFLDRDKTTAFLADFMEAIADTIPDDFSRKAPPALRVVDDEDAYAPDDPKHPTYHGRMADVWDMRERG